MNDYYNGVDNSAYLAHYGVLGMKWGQHLMAKAKSLTPSARKKAKREKAYADEQAKEAARLKQSATNHKRQVMRRQKMTVAQSDAELARLKITGENFDRSSKKAQKQYNDMYTEIWDNIYDWYNDEPKSDAGVKAQQEYKAYKKDHDYNHVDTCSDLVLNALGYKYSAKNQSTNRDIIEGFWRWH